MRVRAMMTTFLFFLITSGLAIAQPFAFGVKAGVPISDAFRFGGEYFDGFMGGKYLSNTKRYTVGPQIDIFLRRRLSIEVDALYKRLDYEYYTQVVHPDGLYSYTMARRNALDRWEFPILIKYRVAFGNHDFFAAAGPSLNYVSQFHSNWEDYGISYGNPYNYSGKIEKTPDELKRRATGGIVFAVGFDFGLGRIGVIPELRYTRWMNTNFTEPWSTGRPFLRSNQNQVEFLLGFTFHRVKH